MDLYSVTSIYELLGRHGFSFKKSLGQNFIIQRSVPERIAEGCGAGENSLVVEIGPGIGTLTAELARRAKKVAAVEIDRRLLPILKETLAEHANIALVEGDIMKLDLSSLVGGFDRADSVACANLPYYITTPVLEKLFESRLFKYICVMVQKEVAERICAEAGTPEYGSFTVFTNFYAQPRTLFPVSAGCFEPKPHVDSAVVLFETREGLPDGIEDEKLFFRVVRAAFAQRRKTLVNCLYGAFGGALTKEMLAGELTLCGLRPDIRGERLNLAQFAELTRALSVRLSATAGAGF